MGGQAGRDSDSIGVDSPLIYEIRLVPGNPRGGIAVPHRKLTALLVALFAIVAAPAQAAPDGPSRVVLIVLDQARPDTIERYDMENVQALMRRGASFGNAIVGHLA